MVPRRRLGSRPGADAAAPGAGAARGGARHLRGGWETVEDALTALEHGLPDRTLLVIDDLHTLESTDAEQALERFIELAPSTLTIVAASRVWPDMNLPRFKVAGELLEIGVDDLRFRSWEVEQLYRDFYGQPLPPEELADAHAAHGGMGGGPAAVPSRHPGQAGRRSDAGCWTASPGRRRG